MSDTQGSSADTHPTGFMRYPAIGVFLTVLATWGSIILGNHTMPETPLVVTLIFDALIGAIAAIWWKWSTTEYGHPEDYTPTEVVLASTAISCGAFIVLTLAAILGMPVLRDIASLMPLSNR